MSSRSRGSSAGQRGAHGGAALGRLGLALGSGLVARGLGGQLGAALAAAQLVERRVARDPEEPGALRAAARIERALLAKRALEGGRGDLLGGRAVAQQRGHVRVDRVRAAAVQRVERRRLTLAGAWSMAIVSGVLHIGATAHAQIRHRSTETRGGPRVSSGCEPVSRNARRHRAARRAGPGRGRRAPGRLDLPQQAPVGDGQRVRHGRAPRLDRDPRVDARHRRQGRVDVHALPGPALRHRRAALAQPGRRGLGLRRGGLGARTRPASRATPSRSRRRAPAPSPTSCAARSPSNGARTARSCAARARARRPRIANTAGSDPPGFSSATCTIT